ncbi:hypothetical protein [Tritonibacter scottomollicae]|uniref:hypothetical protein n=1 Tax=Tritonibacter scottomollicae TaxID=483013 RepID=UPI003AA9B570
MAFRKKLYDSINTLQADLEEWLYHTHHMPDHQGKMCCGKTPVQTMIEVKSGESSRTKSDLPNAQMSD